MSIGYMESGELVECSTIEQLHEEEEARIASDQELRDSIEAEAGERANADSSLQTAIDVEAAARMEADAAEEAARIEGDGALQSAIESEASSRASADESIQASLTTEATTRASQDSLLQANIDAINLNVSSISSSVGSMAVTVAELSDNWTTEKALIEAEASSRTEADEALEAKIAAETTARETADTSINEHIEGLPPEGVDEEGIWHIYTPDGFKAWRDAANADGSASACLHSSLDMEGVEWEPVTTVFTGFFDGGGYSIKNLTFEGTVSSTSVVARGLIVGQMTSGSVSNLTLVNPKLIFENTSTSSSAEDRCGLFVGYINGSSASVRNCHAYSGEISFARHGSGVGNAAGIVGYSGGTVSGCTATSCTCTAESESGAARAGGIVGSSVGTISGCTATSCTCTAESGSVHAQTGGIVGYSGGTVSGCTATSCTCTAESGSSYAQAGGIVGYSVGTVSGCTATSCTCTAESESGAARAGGIVGYSGGQIVGCDTYHNPKIAATTNGSNQMAAAGGIVGHQYYAKTSGCVVESYVGYSNTTARYITATASSGYAYAGGITGFTESAHNSIIGCTFDNASGTKVAITAAGGSRGYAGGIVGYAPSTTSVAYVACANTAEATMTVSGTSSAYGGIAGYAGSASSFTSCVNTGSQSSDDIGNL